MGWIDHCDNGGFYGITGYLIDAFDFFAADCSDEVKSWLQNHCLIALESVERILVPMRHKKCKRTNNHFDENFMIDV